MNRLRFVALRLIAAVPLLLGVLLVTFVLTRLLPADPAVYLAGPSATTETIAEIRVALGLEKSLPEQLWIYLHQVSSADLGKSFLTGKSVADDLAERLPATLELTFCAILFACLVALPMGIGAAIFRDTPIDYACRLIAAVGVSMPAFFSGLMLVFLFYYTLGWVEPPIGRLGLAYLPPPRITGLLTVDSLISGNGGTLMAALHQLLLPASTIAIAVLAPIARMTRAAMLAALESDYVRAARSLGIGPISVNLGFALRNALLPILTTLGMVFSFAIGISIIVEKIFSWPGVGAYAIDSVSASDYAAVQGTILTLAVLYLAMNLAVDILYVVVDPRIGRQS